MKNWMLGLFVAALLSAGACGDETSSSDKENTDDDSADDGKSDDEEETDGDDDTKETGKGNMDGSIKTPPSTDAGKSDAGSSDAGAPLTLKDGGADAGNGGADAGSTDGGKGGNTTTGDGGKGNCAALGLPDFLEGIITCTLSDGGTDDAGFDDIFGP